MDSINKQVCERMYYSLIDNNTDLINIDAVLAKLEILANNHLCSYVGLKATRFPTQLYITDYLLGLDKKLSKYLVDTNLYNNYTESQLKEMGLNNNKKILDKGIYFIDISSGKKSNYIVFLTRDVPTDYGTEPEIKLYFVGDSNIKKYNKFMKKYNKLKDKYNVRALTTVYDIVMDSYDDTIFKSFDNMIFANKDRILAYIDNWVNNLDVYEKYNIVPKLSILIYGPPGTGKTTFAKALANYLNINMITLITQEYFTMKNPPEFYKNNGIVLMDDIDTISNNREDDKSMENKNTVARLLKFLDNPPSCYYKDKDSNDNHRSVQIIIATTNYYDKLDKAVKRFGRFDLQFEMPDFDKEEAIKFCNLYDLQLEDICPKSNNKNFRISPAELQALCISNIDKRIKEKSEV